MKNFKCTLIEQGIHIQGETINLNGESYNVSLLMSYEEECTSWDKGTAWAKEQEGDLPTRAQWLAIQEHQDEINKLLREAGREAVGGGCWTNEECQHNPAFAWIVNMGGGDVYYVDKDSNGYVRAISAFPVE